MRLLDEYLAGMGVVFGLGWRASPPAAVLWGMGSPGQSLGRHRQQRGSKYRVSGLIDDSLVCSVLKLGI